MQTPDSNGFDPGNQAALGSIDIGLLNHAESKDSNTAGGRV